MRKVLHIILLTLVVSIQSYSQGAKNLHVNLGKNINTSKGENGPKLSPDGKTLYFWRWRNSDKSSPDFGLDVWKSELGRNGQWKKAVKMGKPFNVTGFDAINSVGKYGNSVIVNFEYKDGEYEGPGFSISNKVNGKWRAFETIEIDQFDAVALGEFMGVTMSNDGTVLILHLCDEKGSTEGDLFVSFIKADDTWTKPKKIHGNINSENSELSPFISADGATLYFTSNREGGVGCYDIYMASRLDDTWLNWTEPVNLGTSVNTDVCEMYLSLDANEEYAYFGSLYQSEYGDVDIVKVALPDSLKPKNQKKIITTDTIFVQDYNEGVDVVNQINASTENFLVATTSNHISNEDFRIYPNPVDDNFFIEITGDFSDKIVVTIVNSHGQLMMKNVIEDLTNSSIYKQRYDVSDYAPGMYIVSFNDGEVIVSKRIVIE